LTALSDRPPRSAPSTVASRGASRVVYRYTPVPAHPGRRAEHVSHGVSVIEHALMVILLAGMVMLVIGAIAHPTHDLWQNVTNGLSR
jgi:hypothetical protein